MHHPWPNASMGERPRLASPLLALSRTTMTNGYPARAVLQHQTVLVQPVARHPSTNASPYPAHLSTGSYLVQIHHGRNLSRCLACPLSVLPRRPRRYLCQLHVGLKLRKQRLRHHPLIQSQLLKHSFPSLNRASWRHAQRTPPPSIGRITHRTNVYR